jgi:hypothetical protein
MDSCEYKQYAPWWGILEVNQSETERHQQEAKKYPVEQESHQIKEEFDI